MTQARGDIGHAVLYISNSAQIHFFLRSSWSEKYDRTLSIISHHHELRKLHQNGNNSLQDLPAARGGATNTFAAKAVPPPHRRVSHTVSCRNPSQYFLILVL